MRPELFRIPVPDWVPVLGREIPVFGYGLMLVIGFYCAMQVGRALARRCGIDPDVVVNIALIALISGIVGARLSHVLENFGEYTSSKRSFAENLFAMINIRSGGLTFYGGMIVATFACIYYGLRAKVPIRLGMDVIAPCVMIGLGFGRIGCFLNGCCYGAQCDVPWAVHFPYHSAAYEDQFKHKLLHVPPELVGETEDGRPVLLKQEDVKASPDAQAALRTKTPGVTTSLAVHPAQLYSAFNAFLIAGVLIAFFTLQPPPGRVFALMLILKGITRFLLEMVRAEPAVLGPLSFSMALSIVLFALGVVMWRVVGRMNPAWPKFTYATPQAATA